MLQLSNKMKKKNIVISFLYLVFLIGCTFFVGIEKLNTQVDSLNMLLDKEEIETLVQAADSIWVIKPVTITSYRAERSQGGLHDYYSEGSYWWPDPQCMSCKYIRKDGHRNPNNFKAHKIAIRNFSNSVSILTAAYHLTSNETYARRAVEHLDAWFISEDTKMNPSLLYAQAIKGICSGRGIGIIDAVKLIDVALSIEYLIDRQILKGDTLTGVRNWFGAFAEWLTTHPYGINEKNNNNNHSTWWGAQLAAYASVAERQEYTEISQAEFKKQLDIQMSQDGSFPRELSRTRPFHYMNYNLNAWTRFAHIASTPEENLWKYKAKYGDISKAIEYAVTYYQDASLWEHATELETEIKPMSDNFLILTYWAYKDRKYKDLWEKLPPIRKGKVERSVNILLYAINFCNE
jgi:hypothetical protein